MKKFILGTVFGTTLGMVLGPVIAVKIALKLAEVSPDSKVSGAVEDLIESLAEVEGDEMAEWIFGPIEDKALTRLGVPKEIRFPNQDKTDRFMDEVERLLVQNGFVTLGDLKNLVNERTTFHDEKVAWMGFGEITRLNSSVRLSRPSRIRG